MHRFVPEVARLDGIGRVPLEYKGIKPGYGIGCRFPRRTDDLEIGGNRVSRDRVGHYPDQITDTSHNHQYALVGVDEPVTVGILLARLTEIIRIIHDEELDLVDREVGVRLPHQGDDTRRVGSGHRCPAPTRLLVSASRNGGVDVDTRCHDLGLDRVITPDAVGRTTAREAGDRVGVTIIGGVDRADREVFEF